MRSRSGRRRRGVLAILAAMLVIGGLVLATTAPAGPSTNNKLDAYGGPVPVKPTNPKTKAQCDRYYSVANKLAEAQGCRALAAYNQGPWSVRNIGLYAETRAFVANVLALQRRFV